MASFLDTVYFLNKSYTKFIRVGLHSVDGALVTLISTTVGGGKRVVEVSMSYDVWIELIKRCLTDNVETRFNKKIEDKKDCCIVMVARKAFGKQYIQIRDEIGLKGVMLTVDEWKCMCTISPQITNYLRGLHEPEAWIMEYIESFNRIHGMIIDPPGALTSLLVNRLRDEVLFYNSTRT